MKLYVKHFWKVLPIIFTKDFWFTNKMLKKKQNKKYNKSNTILIYPNKKK